MNPLHDRLLAECRLIAQQTMWNPPLPTGMEDIIDSDERERVAQAYFQDALKEIDYVATGDHSPEVVLRAVQYLGVHAMPPLRDSTSWFREGLHTLLVLACPFAGVPPGGELFFSDIRRGMEIAESWRTESGV